MMRHDLQLASRMRLSSCQVLEDKAYASPHLIMLERVVSQLVCGVLSVEVCVCLVHQVVIHCKSFLM